MKQRVINTIKYLIFFLKNSLYTLKWLGMQIISEDFTNYIEKTNEEIIAILANGPSLNEDIKKLNSHYKNLKITYCVLNYFCSDKNFFYNLKPSYYVFADPVLLSKKYITTREMAVLHTLNHTDWEMRLLIPFSYYKNFINENYITNPYIKIIPYHTNIYNGFKNVKFYLYKKGLSMPRVQNVLIACIFNAINSGFKEILLCGTDHSWTKELIVDLQNRVCLKDLHFYDQGDIQFKPWMKTSGEHYKMHEILRDLAFMFEGYYILEEYAILNKCKIKNLTEKSFIDAFYKVI